MLTAPYSPQAATPAVAASAREPGVAYLSVILGLAVSYQLWLALGHTHFGVSGRGAVVAAEAAIVAASLPLVLKRLPLGLCLVAALLIANACLLSLSRGALDIKSLRDLLVPLLFLWVGMNVSSPGTGDRVMRNIVWLVLGFALFEFLFLERFTQLFDIHSYYIARGVGDPEMGLYREDKLVASGIRPEGIGRTILPFLGPHRVSSVFVEPVSFGNFAVICAAWGLAKPREEWRAMFFFVSMAALMLVLNDSRFGLVSIALLVVLRVAMLRRLEPVAMFFPLACALLLILIAHLTGGMYSDTFTGRLTLTGVTLMKMSLGDVFGLVTPRHGYFDMGYPYILANFGLVASLLLWGAYWLLPLRDDAGRRFQAYAALYLALILCVSGTSVFAFKTSALLWFLLGSFAARREA